MKKIDCDKVEFEFTCLNENNCEVSENEEIYTMTMRQVLEVGHPICSCDHEMELLDLANLRDEEDEDPTVEEGHY
jgi:hypothetical protein